MLVESFSNIQSEVFLTIFIVLLVYLIGFVITKSGQKFPPGPVGLPIVGYIPFLSKDVHLKFTHLAQKYGEVFSLRLGSETVVVLNSTETIREAFSKKEFLGRPPQSSFSLFGNKSPFFLSNMKVWHEQRRFAVQSLKDLGLGRSKIEENVQDEICHFLQKLKAHNGKSMDIKEPLTPSISNNICALAFGKRYDYKDPERIMLDYNLDAVIKIIGQTASHIFFPWMKYFQFILKWFNYHKAVLASRNSDELFKLKIREHEKTLDPKNIRDFIDSYLVEMEIRKKKEPDTTFTEDTLIGCIGDLFGAGSETVRTSISWCVYIMAAYPEIQKRVYKEIQDVLGSHRMAEYQDFKAMTYTHAVILEIMRWKTIVPLNPLRYTIEDTSVGGYDIPRNTIIMANFWAVHHDPKFWDKPDSFQPERFIGSDGNSIVKSPHYMPFSVGKRVCPGESMAYMEIFLYFASILQNFEVQFPKGVEPNFDAELTISYHLKPYKICLFPRN